MGAEDAHTEEWRDPSVAAWEEAAAASSSADGGAQGSHAQHAQPWTESLAPALVDAIARFGASISADSNEKRGPAHDDARHGATERASDRERGRQARTRVER